MSNTPTNTTTVAAGDSHSRSGSVPLSRTSWLTSLGSTATALGGLYVSLTVARDLASKLEPLLKSQAPWWVVTSDILGTAIAAAPASAWPAIAGALKDLAGRLPFGGKS